MTVQPWWVSAPIVYNSLIVVTAFVSSKNLQLVHVAGHMHEESYSGLCNVFHPCGSWLLSNKLHMGDADYHFGALHPMCPRG